jgi:hypothetical protein
MTYNEASDKACRARDPERGYRLENNTRLLNRGDHFAVKYHVTDIVEIYHNGLWKIQNGGWFTSTTKERINRYSPVRVYQEDYNWYIRNNGGEDIGFRSGIWINEAGEIVQEPDGYDFDARKRASEQVKQLVSGYLDWLEEYLNENGIPEPEEYDAGEHCFTCYYPARSDVEFTEYKRNRGIDRNQRHLLAHVKQKEYPAPLPDCIDLQVGRKPGITRRFGDPDMIVRHVRDFLQRGQVRNRMIDYVMRGVDVTSR